MRSFGVVIAIIIILLAGCDNPRTGVVFWPITAHANNITPVNDGAQLKALIIADPVQDAEDAFHRGDLRFIGDRFVFPNVFGAPDEEVVFASIRSRQIKIIAFSTNLSTNGIFMKKKYMYEYAFNRVMYDLIRSEKFH